jgi:carbamate kinase
VIDKDRASALLASKLGAERLLILTDVDAVYRDFGTDRQQEIRSLSVDDAEALAPELAEGSIKPKLEAAATFVRATGGGAIITSADGLADALRTEAGTHVIP